MLACVATLIVAAKVFIKPAPQRVVSQATPLPSAPSWNGVLPGKTTVDQILSLVGKPESEESQNGRTELEIKRNGDGPPHSIITQGNTVKLVKDRVLTGNLDTFKEKYGEPENQYWGEHQKVGFKTYVWTKNGIAVVAHNLDGAVFEVWYFEPTTLENFLSNFGKNLSVERKKDGGY